MTRLRRLTAVFVLTAPLLVAAGCKQGAGDRCQVDSDCADGLTCVLPAGGTPQAGGTCQAPGMLTAGDMASIDMAVPTPTDGFVAPGLDMTQGSGGD